MPAPLRIHLTPEDDARLRELETNPVVPFKVRRRAQAVRLAAQGWTAPRIARHLGLDRTTLHRDLRRWLERGIEGLGQRSYLEDGKPPGARPRWTPAMSAFLGELLAGEEAWTAPRLLEALERRFFVTFHPGTVRRKLLEMGYQWKRTRYVPTGKPTAEERERFEAALGEAERGG
jgi:transposase